MKRIMIIGVLALALLSGGGAAQAGCYAEYKAKRDNPLRLFYDVAVIAEPCTMASAHAQLRAMLASRGLTLLTVMSVRQQ